MSNSNLKRQVRRAAAHFLQAMEHDTPEARKKYLKEHPNADPKNHSVGKGDNGGDTSKSPELASRKDLMAVKRKIRSIDTARAKVQQAVRETGVAGYNKPAKIQKAVRKVAPHVGDLLKEAKRVGEALDQMTKNPPPDSKRDKAFWKKYRDRASKWEKHLKETMDALNKDIKKWPDPEVVGTLQSMSSDAVTFSHFLADLPK